VRILYHHRTQAEDGQAVHIRALIRAFEAAGHAVHEVGLVERTGAPRRSSGPSRWSLVTRLPRFARELAEYAYSGVARGRLMQAAADFEPDFLYERYAFGNAAGVMAARRLHKPLVLEVNSPLVLELSRTRGLSFPRLAERLERHVLTSADRVCVVTEVLGQMLVEQGVERRRLVVTPNGVDLAAYEHPDRAAARRAARADLGLAAEAPPQERVLGFVGYYRPWHRLELAVAALRASELAHARLVLIGAGPAEDELRAAALAAGVAERVHFAGRRPHERIPALLPAFDAALLPAINPYASPLKLHEYMAAGLAVVAPDQPNLREVLRHGENALLVPPGDARALEAALARLAGDPAECARLGAAARRTIVARDLTWSANVARVLAAVEELR
jgi:glycosyltransferase involved in cell wall biosynthesis